MLPPQRRLGHVLALIEGKRFFTLHAGRQTGKTIAQHTERTGQRFTAEAVARIYELGSGHPWLTNALADQIVRRDVPDRGVEITAAHVDAAKETIIIERRTHIDSLSGDHRRGRARRRLRIRARPRPDS